jgi:hypothetical protein
MTISTAGQAKTVTRSGRESRAARPRQAELEVLPLSDDEWRVNDPARAERDGIPLVGFIKKTDDMFEVTQLGAPHEHLRFSTLAMAVAYLQWPGSGSA